MFVSKIIPFSHISSFSLFIYSCFSHTYLNDLISVPSSPHRYKNGQARPYSLELGRCIKQKLWERLDRPTFTSSVTEDGLVHVDVSYGLGVLPPLYYVDTFGEPEPGRPPLKRPRTST